MYFGKDNFEEKIKKILKKIFERKKIMKKILKKNFKKNLEIGVTTKLIVTVPLKMFFLHI